MVLDVACTKFAHVSLYAYNYIKERLQVALQNSQKCEEFENFPYRVSDKKLVKMSFKALMAGGLLWFCDN